MCVWPGARLISDVLAVLGVEQAILQWQRAAVLMMRAPGYAPDILIMN